MIGAVISLASVAVQAAPDPPPDEIVVTGERVERSLRNTPSSVVVFTSAELERQPDSDRLDSILAQVPNVQFGTGGQGPTIRGHDSSGPLQDLPAFLGGTRPRVTLSIDGRAASFNEFIFGVAPLWDVQQIEVFRSPQTTTQGRNAIAGAIFIETVDPSFDWEGRGRVMAGSLDRRHISALVSGPLVEDQLAFRAVADLKDGRPGSRLADLGVGTNPNQEDFSLLRLKLLAQPRALAGLRIEGGYSRVRSEMPQIEGVKLPFEERRDPLPRYGIFRTKVDSLTLSAEAPVRPDLHGRMTLSAGDSRFTRFAPAGLGEADTKVDDFSVEALLAWTPRTGTSVTGGVHHLRSRLDQTIDLSAVVGLGQFDDRQRSLGLFGEATVRLLPRLSVTAGLRYQSDRQDRRGQMAYLDGPRPIDFDDRFDSWLPKLSAAYDLGRTATVGVLVQRASNPGGVTLNFETGDQAVFGAESLWSYELFARGSAGSGLSFEANLFHQRIRNAQRAEPRTFIVPGQGALTWAIIHNVPRGRTLGAEASARWRPSPYFEARAAIGLLDTRISDPADASPFDGKVFQRSPERTWRMEAIWNPTPRLKLSAAMRHNSGYFSNDANSPSLAVDEATEIDMRTSYRIGRATLFGYARNALDEFNMTYLFTPGFGTASRPREVGVGIESAF